MDGLTAFIVVLFLFFLYLLPGLVATNRKHNNAPAIWVLTLLAGWTVVCWLIALVWAFTDNVRQEEPVRKKGKSGCVKDEMSKMPQNSI